MKDGRVTVLVAEDNRHLGDALETFLQRADIEVTLVRDGQAAIEAAQEAGEPFDIVVTDNNMPRRSGMEVATVLRRVAAYSETPIFLFTANDRAEFDNLDPLAVEYVDKSDIMGLRAAVHETADGIAAGGDLG